MPKSKRRKPKKSNRQGARNLGRRTAAGERTLSPGGVCARLPRPDVNGQYIITVVPQFAPGTPEAAAPRGPGGSPGKYSATFVLCVPGKESYHADLNISQLVRSGESLLLLSPEKQEVRMSFVKDPATPPVILRKNDRNQISSCHVEIEADNFTDATEKAYSLVMPLLSWLSYSYDVALDVLGYQIIEDGTSVNRFSFKLLGVEKRAMDTVPLDILMTDENYRTILAAYREGVSSTSVFYQFLSYFKVIEGISVLRKRREREYKRNSVAYVPPIEAFPGKPDGLGLSTKQERALFTPYLGRGFEEVKTELSGLTRDAIAHLVPREQELIPDRFEDTNRCLEVLPVAKYMARVMLDNEIATLQQEYASGRRV